MSNNLNLSKDSANSNSDDEEFDPSTLSTAARHGLILKSQWLSLKERLREFTLHLRREGTHVISFLTRADEDNTETLDIDDVMTILSTLQFEFLPDDIIDELVEQNDNFFPPSTFTDRTVILKRFADFRGNVNYVRFYDSLELEPPKDFLNPDQFFDPLPQPYRLIAKTLDGIFDDVWLVLRDRHPGLKELAVTNPELYGLGPPRKIIEVDEAAHASPSSTLESYGTITAQEWSVSGSMLAAGTASGHFVLVNPKGVVKVDGAGPTGFGGMGFSSGVGSAAAASSCILGNCAVFTDIPFGISHISKPVRPKGSPLRCVRIAVAAPFTLDPEETDESTPEDNEGEADDDKPIVHKVAVVECWQTFMEGGKHYSCQVIATGQTDAPLENIELSADGLYLAGGLEDGGACVWGLPAPIQPDIDNDPVSLAMKGKGKGKRLMKTVDEGVAGKGGEPINEDDEDDEDEDEEGGGNKGVEEEEVLVVDLGLPLFRTEPPPEPEAAPPSVITEEASQVSQSSKKGKKGAPAEPEVPPVDYSPATLAKKKSRHLARFIFLPGPKNHRTTLASAGSAGKNGLTATVIIWRTLSNVWKQYKLPSYDPLKPRVDDEVGEAAAAAAPAKGKAGKGKGAAAEAEAAPARSKNTEADLTLVGRWIMSGNITTACKCEEGGTTNIAFGCSDGTVVLWESKTNTPIAGCSSHQSAVSSICLASGARYLVSGDLEGTLHFHDLDTYATLSSTKARDRHNSSQSSLGSRKAMSRAGSSRSLNNKSRGHTADDEAHNLAKVMEKVLMDPRDSVSLTMRRDEDFSSPIVSCVAVKSGVGGVPIALCADMTGRCVVYDAATGDLVGKLSPYVISGHAHDLPTEGYTTPITASQAANLCQRKAADEERMIPSASQEDLMDLQVFDAVKQAMASKCMIGCGSECVTIVAGSKELLGWKPPPPEENSEQQESSTLRSVPSSSVLSDTDDGLAMPPTSMAVFAVGDIITSLCPGIAASCGGEDVEVLGGAPARHLAVSLFSRLTPAQRKDPTLELNANMLGIKPGRAKGSSRGGGSSVGGSGKIMSRQNTSESAYGIGSKKGLHSKAGSRAVSRARTSTAGSKKSLQSNDVRSIGSVGTNGGSEAGNNLTTENLNIFLNKKKSKAKIVGGGGMVWGSDPAAKVVGLAKGDKKKMDGAEDRQARMKKRREELLAMLS
ncbi:hypothetical protein TrVE_jg6202 [Triparma verrucosa]|uniref:Uncharacterized protein n=1 Tax=Triparma verrucosa TaxID=1606542 RepID=A0A9W7BFE8_9STRA|nr:hypothetical protein TrVE_jg6202 [Triparma verrucosa]